MNVSTRSLAASAMYMQSVATTMSNVSPSALAAPTPHVSSFTSHLPSPQFFSKFSRSSGRFSGKSVATTRAAPALTNTELTSPHPAPSSHTLLFTNKSRRFSTYLARTMAESHTVDAKPPLAPPASKRRCVKRIFSPHHSCSYGSTNRSSSVFASRFHAHLRMKSEAPDPVKTRLGFFFFPRSGSGLTVSVSSSGASRFRPFVPVSSPSSPDPPHPSGSSTVVSTRTGFEPPTSSSSEKPPKSISFASKPAVAAAAAAAATASPPFLALVITSSSLAGAEGPRVCHGFART